MNVVELKLRQGTERIEFVTVEASPTEIRRAVAEIRRLLDKGPRRPPPPAAPL